MLKEKLPWIVVAVLSAVLIIVSFLWVDAMNKLDSGNLSAQRDLIREYCSKTDEDSRAKCQVELDDMNNMLKQFRKDIKAERAGASAQVQVETVPVEPVAGQ